MEVSDLPTLFQICVAQESNAQQIESLHTLFQKQQITIDHLKEIIDAQQRVLDDLISYVQSKK
jgi:hypothetical protein